MSKLNTKVGGIKINTVLSGVHRLTYRLHFTASAIYKPCSHNSRRSQSMCVRVLLKAWSYIVQIS